MLINKLPLFNVSQFKLNTNESSVEHDELRFVGVTTWWSNSGKINLNKSILKQIYTFYLPFPLFSGHAAFNSSITSFTRDKK